MREVVLDAEGEVASDGSRGGVEGVGGSHHGANGLDGVLALNSESDDGRARQIIANRTEERSLAVLVVVRFDGGSLGMNQFQADKAQASGFDTSRNFSDQVPLNSAGLDENEGGFQCHGSLQFTGPSIPPNFH